MAEKESHSPTEYPYITFSDEQVYLSFRSHSIQLALPLFYTISSFLFFLLIGIGVFRYVIPSFVVFATYAVALCVVFFTIAIKIIVSWYFHVYIVTNHKILEFQYNPYITEEVNEVMLDQVRCTEIDVQTNGVINQIFNKGDIHVTFDRPTHEEGFVFESVASPNDIALQLGRIITPEQMRDKMLHNWVKSAGKKNKLILLDELHPS